MTLNKIIDHIAYVKAEGYDPYEIRCNPEDYAEISSVLSFGQSNDVHEFMGLMVKKYATVEVGTLYIIGTPSTRHETEDEG